VALVAITRGGARLAAAVAQALPGAEVYASPKWRAEAGSDAQPLAGGVGREVGRLFAAYDGLVIFAAVGAAVRLVAPHLRSKGEDPGVVAVDDAGRYAVAVLSGHLGGGNALARRVAAAIGGEPVITTASEAHGLPAVDLLGRAWGWRLEQPAAAKRVSAALVNGELVGVVQEAGETSWWPADAPQLVSYESPEALAASGLPGIVIMDRLLPDLPPADRWVVLRPRTLVLGVGASSGVTTDEIETLARAALAGAGLAWASLVAVGTLDRKVGEPGIDAFAARHGLSLHGYAADALAAVAVPHPSGTVQRLVGTPSVCEAAALLAAQGGPLVVAKRKSARATVAVARRAAAGEPAAAGETVAAGETG